MKFNFKIKDRVFIIRRRVKLRRFGYASGDCFNKIHFGKVSLYIEREDARRIGFQALADDKGVQVIAKKVKEKKEEQEEVLVA